MRSFFGTCSYRGEHILSGRFAAIIPSHIIRVQLQKATRPFLLIAGLRHLTMICKVCFESCNFNCDTALIQLGEMFAEAVKETCFHLTLCPCENQKVAWNLFSNGISPWFECDWFGLWGRIWRLCSALRCSLRCAIVSCSCENIQPFIEEFLQIFTSVLQEKRWGWRKGPRGGSACPPLPFFTTELPKTLLWGITMRLGVRNHSN